MIQPTDFPTESPILDIDTSPSMGDNDDDDFWSAFSNDDDSGGKGLFRGEGFFNDKGSNMRLYGWDERRRRHKGYNPSD